MSAKCAVAITIKLLVLLNYCKERLPTAVVKLVVTVVLGIDIAL